MAEEKKDSAGAAADNAAVENEDTNTLIWYFAIGSMMHPPSCQSRKFVPQKSQAAELLGYRLHFFGKMGVAQAVEDSTASMHGVLHLVTMEQMKELDKIEMGYIRCSGKARPYNNNDDNNTTLIDCTVYCRDPNASKMFAIKKEDDHDALPRERYLDIMIAGAKHYGVKQEYIQLLQDHPREPRRLPDEFESFGDAPPDKHYTAIPENETNSETGEIIVYSTVNGKVLQATYPPKHPYGAMALKSRVERGHAHNELTFSKLLYDPKYGTHDNLNEFTRQHCAYIEDFMYQMCKEFKSLAFHKIVGSFEQTFAD